jgi:hypothetical protein
MWLRNVRCDADGLKPSVLSEEVLTYTLFRVSGSLTVYHIEHPSCASCGVRIHIANNIATRFRFEAPISNINSFIGSITESSTEASRRNVRRTCLGSSASRCVFDLITPWLDQASVDCSHEPSRSHSVFGVVVLRSYPCLVEISPHDRGRNL